MNYDTTQVCLALGITPIGMIEVQLDGKNIGNWGASGELHAFYGKTHTEESRERMRQQRLGKRLSEETKARMSKALSGRTHSEETKNKISSSHMGKKHSDEAKAKQSAAKKGKPLSDEHKSKLIGKKHSPQTIEKMKRQRENTKWITDGVVNKKIHLHDEIPEGWRRGKVRRST